MYWKAIGPDKYKFNNLANFAGKYIYPETNASTLLHVLCNQSAKSLLNEVLTIQVVIVFSYLSVVIGPIYAYLYKDLHVSPMGTRLPFFDDDETEFLVNVGLQCTGALYALFGNLAIETVSCLINNAILLSAEVIQLNGNHLTERLEDEINNQGITIETRALFRNILLQIRDFDTYIKQNDHLFVENKVSNWVFVLQLHRRPENNLLQ